MQKLLRFSETETDGGRDILRAAEVTSDPLLRRLYLEHALDEFRHGVLFRQRAGTVLREFPCCSKPAWHADWLAPGGHGLDDFQVEPESDVATLAFLHLSEKAAASRFTVYRDLMRHDLPTRAVFEEILRDERFHGRHQRAHLDDSILRLFAALCVARKASRAAGSPRLDPDLPRTQPFAQKAVLT